RDSSGLPIQIGPYSVKYNAGRRLATVNRGAKIIASYHHNAYGHRISKSAGGVLTHYLYHENRLLAEATSESVRALGQSEAPPPRIRRRYIYVRQVPVGFIDYSDEAPQGRLYFVHSDLLAAPRVVTDQN